MVKYASTEGSPPARAYRARRACLGPHSGRPVLRRDHPEAQGRPADKSTTYSFKVATEWTQQLSTDFVPIQGTGTPGPPVDLTNPGGAVNLGGDRSSPSRSWDRSS
jgi:hypothetical protein